MVGLGKVKAKKIMYQVLPFGDPVCEDLYEFFRRFGSVEGTIVEGDTGGVDQGQATAQAARVIGFLNVKRKEYVGQILRRLKNFMH